MIAVLPYVIHPKTAVLGRAGGVILRDLSHESHAVVVLFNKEWRAVA